MGAECRIQDAVGCTISLVTVHDLGGPVLAHAAAGGRCTEVTWSMAGHKTFMTRVMGVFRSMDSMVGPDFEKGFARLKVLAER